MKRWEKSISERIYAVKTRRTTYLFLGNLYEMLRLSRVDREWLFAAYVLSILKAKQYVLIVMTMRCSYVHNVHICILDEFLVAAVAL